MDEQLAGWRTQPSQRGGLQRLSYAGELVGKYATKAINGFNHSVAFTTGGFHEPIQITPRNRAVTEAACRKCHAEIWARSPRRWAGRSRAPVTLPPVPLGRGFRAFAATTSGGAPADEHAGACSSSSSLLAAVAAVAVRRARHHLRAQAGGAEPVLPRRRAERRHGRSRRSGARTSRRSTTATGGPSTGAHALRRQRGDAADTDRRPIPRSVVAQSRLEEDPRLKTIWAGYAFAQGLPRGARPRLHARRPDLHRAAAGRRSSRAPACTATRRSTCRTRSSAAATSSRASRR